MTDTETLSAISFEYGFLDAKHGQEYYPRGDKEAYRKGWQSWGVYPQSPAAPIHQQHWSFWNERDHADFLKLIRR